MRFYSFWLFTNDMLIFCACSKFLFDVVTDRDFCQSLYMGKISNVDNNFSIVTKILNKMY